MKDFSQTFSDVSRIATRLDSIGKEALAGFSEFRANLSSSATLVKTAIDTYISNYVSLQTFAADGTETTDAVRSTDAKGSLYGVADTLSSLLQSASDNKDVIRASKQAYLVRLVRPDGTAKYVQIMDASGGGVDQTVVTVNSGDPSVNNRYCYIDIRQASYDRFSSNRYIGAFYGTNGWNGFLIPLFTKDDAQFNSGAFPSNTATVYLHIAFTRGNPDDLYVYLCVRRNDAGDPWQVSASVHGVSFVTSIAPSSFTSANPVLYDANSNFVENATYFSPMLCDLGQTLFDRTTTTQHNDPMEISPFLVAYGGYLEKYRLATLVSDMAAHIIS